MAAKPTPTWQSKLNAAIRRDPRKTGLLTVLAVVFAIFFGRAVIGQKANPAPAPAGMLPEVKPTTGSENGLKASGKRDNSAAMRQWLSSKPAKIDRNLFAVQLNYYPQASDKAVRPANPSDQDKSAVQDADDLKERQARFETLKLQAKQFKLQSTLMSATPRALINGDLLKEGDQIAASADESAKFRVVKIEARRVILEREGEKIVLWMN